MRYQSTATSQIISEIRRPSSLAVPDEREADERFVAWVLGYGYAAQHLNARRSEHAVAQGGRVA